MCNLFLLFFTSRTSIIWYKLSFMEILKARKIFVEAGMTEEDVTQLHTYSIEKVYGMIRNEAPKVPWRILVYINKGVPKWFQMRLLKFHGGYWSIITKGCQSGCLYYTSQSRTTQKTPNYGEVSLLGEPGRHCLSFMSSGERRY